MPVYLLPIDCEIGPAVADPTIEPKFDIDDQRDVHIESK